MCLVIDILGSIDNLVEIYESLIKKIDELVLGYFKDFYNTLTVDSTIGEQFTCMLGGTPNTKNPAFWDGDINWINSGEVNELRICKPSRMITTLGMKSSATKLLHKGTTVIAITGATLGQVSLLEIDSCANQSVIGIYSDLLKQDYIYPLIKSHIFDLVSKQTGGAQQHINMNDVKTLKIKIPSKNQYDEYSKKVLPFFQKQSSICEILLKLKELKELYLKKFFG